MACEYQVDFFIDQSPIEVYRLLSKRTYLGNFKVDYIDPRNFKIYLASKASLLSWGEEVTISVFDAMNGGTRVIVHSKPRLGTTLIDYGKNKQNVVTMQAIIESICYS